MVSRRAILSRSRDDLNMEDARVQGTDDQWFSKEKLYKDHIVEVLSKWDNIDDEIWAKVIVLERNRRIAKAYARAPVLTVNGSEDGFDGFRIGVNGFENPLRDPKTEEFKKQIGSGCKLKMDDTGNILVKRLAKSNIYVKNTLEENAVSNDILKLPNGCLEAEKPFKLFDMKKFQQNVNRELKRQYPERQKLETQCISTVGLVKNEEELLDSPIWIMLINIVALEMLKAKMPRNTGPGRMIVPAGQFQNGVPAKKPAGSGSSDEDPYSLTPSGSSGSSGKGGTGNRVGGVEPTRGKEKEYYPPQNWVQKGGVNDLSDDYIEEEMNAAAMMKGRGGARGQRYRTKKGEEKRERLDDPYYHGLSARVTAFTQHKNREKNFSRMKSPNRMGGGPPGGIHMAGAIPPGQAWWHSRLYPEDMAGYPDGRGNNVARNRIASPTRNGAKGGNAPGGRPAVFRNGWE